MDTCCGTAIPLRSGDRVPLGSMRVGVKLNEGCWQAVVEERSVDHGLISALLSNLISTHLWRACAFPLCHLPRNSDSDSLRIVFKITCLRYPLLTKMPHADSALVPSGIDREAFWSHIHEQLSHLLAGQRDWVCLRLCTVMHQRGRAR